MQPEDKGELQCCIPKCTNLTSRLVQGKPVCTKHFLEGFGRLEGKDLPNLPSPEAPLYVSDKPSKKPRGRR